MTTTHLHSRRERIMLLCVWLTDGIGDGGGSVLSALSAQRRTCTLVMFFVRGVVSFIGVVLLITLIFKRNTKTAEFDGWYILGCYTYSDCNDFLKNMVDL